MKEGGKPDFIQFWFNLVLAFCGPEVRDFGGMVYIWFNLVLAFCGSEVHDLGGVV